MRIIFRGERCRMQLRQYANGRPALELVLSDTGERMAVASVNLPDEPLEADEIAIKDYEENAGMLELLLDNHVVSGPLRHVASDHVMVPICKLIWRPRPIGKTA